MVQELGVVLVLLLELEPVVGLVQVLDVVRDVEFLLELVLGVVEELVPVFVVVVEDMVGDKLVHNAIVNQIDLK